MSLPPDKFGVSHVVANGCRKMKDYSDGLSSNDIMLTPSSVNADILVQMAEMGDNENTITS